MKQLTVVTLLDGCGSEGEGTAQWDRTPYGVLCICWQAGNLLKISASPQITPSPFQTKKFSVQG